MKTIIQIALGLLIVLLSFVLYKRIIEPIHFNKHVDVRVDAATSRLIEIRKVQYAFKDVFNRYTDNFDTLIDFIKYDSFYIQKKTGSYNPDEMSEKEAIDLGLIQVGLTPVSIRDSLFKENRNIDSIRYVPFVDDREFYLDAGQIVTSSGVAVKVFEVYVLYNILFEGMNGQLVANYVDEREKIAGFPGLRIGSMIEATNHTGNWE